MSKLLEILKKHLVEGELSEEGNSHKEIIEKRFSEWSQSSTCKYILSAMKEAMEVAFEAGDKYGYELSSNEEFGIYFTNINPNKETFISDFLGEEK